MHVALGWALAAALLGRCEMIAGQKVEMPSENRPFCAEYVIGVGVSPAHVRVIRDLEQRLRLEFLEEHKPRYMKIIIYDKRNNRAVELDPESRRFWGLKDVIEPPWLSLPTSRMIASNDTKVILGAKCRLYLQKGPISVQTWVAEDLGVAVSQSQILDGFEQVTLHMTSLNIAEPDPKLFVVPQNYQEIKEPRIWDEQPEE